MDRGPEDDRAASCHSIVTFATPVLLTSLTLQYAAQHTSPFQTHPKTMGLSVGCSLLYGLAYGGHLRFSSALHQSPTYATACGRCMEWSGSMLLASLTSIFFPDSVQWVFLMFYAILFMGGLLYTLLQMLRRWIHPTPAVAAGHLGLEAAQPRESVLAQTSGSDQGITVAVN